MSDLISRSLLIEKLQKWKFANEERGYDTARDLVQEMIDLVKEQKLISGNDGWIPVSERLPEETECYLVTWRDRGTCKNYVEIIEYDVESSWLDCICQAGLLGYDIIAWQPLPTPYVQQ